MLGLRHGFDYDHLAAITDIASVQRGWREGMRLGLLYALGHAAMIAVLGAPVILFHLALPRRMDFLGERLVGATLVGLGAYVLAASWRAWRRPRVHAHDDFPTRSRVALLISAARYSWWRLRTLVGMGGERPEPFAFRYSGNSVFLVGVVHGLGAETPSQVLLFLVAANLGGPRLGLAGLMAFVAGLLLMNTAMTASASGIFFGSTRRPGLLAAVTSLTAAYSLAVGLVFLLGWSARLPDLH